MQCNVDDSPVTNSSLTTFGSTKPDTSSTQTDTPTTTSLESITPATTRSSQDLTILTTQPTFEATSTAPTTQFLTSAHQETTTNPTSKTQFQPTTFSASTVPTASKDSPQTSSTPLITSETNQVTTNLNKTPTTITTKSGTTQLPPTPTPDVARSCPRNDEGTSPPQNMSFEHKACEMLRKMVKGNCTVHCGDQGKTLTVTITVDVKHDIKSDICNTQTPNSGVTDNNTSQKDDANKDTIPDTLIAILASCGALVFILCCFAAYCTYHRRSYRKNQQHLTEELQTVENGYHDNPTLEVMEVQPEMQEKKPTLNGEFNDSWIVPIDNLLKEEIPDEEDTHL
ncbi:Podocalyxin [Labeo rohita]|uniref:Podocalyxin n=1 Tax=Labeo rohita TaxID=84645 RepID=A0ABQ8MRK4_LABRO|nr:Podocalyxin [Labeo rohita]